MPLPLVISHAACAGHAPENTLAGIRAALKLKADAIEVDLHATRDGVPVLLHDDTVDRTTDGAGFVWRLGYVELRRLRADRAWPDRRFARERVPSLLDVLDLVARRALLVLEIKQPGIEPSVVEAVRRAGAGDDTAAWSFHPQALAAMRAIAPEIPCGLLLAEPVQGDWARTFARAARLGVQTVAVHHEAVTPSLTALAARRGLGCFAWTADRPDDIGRCAAAGALGIVSNHPDRARRTLEERGG